MPETVNDLLQTALADARNRYPKFKSAPGACLAIQHRADMLELDLKYSEPPHQHPQIGRRFLQIVVLALRALEDLDIPLPKFPQ